MATKLWFGDEDSLHKMMSIHEKIEAADEALRKQAADWEDDDDEEMDTEHWMMQCEGNVAIINVEGPMVSGRTGFWGQWFGYCGYDDIKEAIQCALNCGATDFILDWDTPGGSVDGIEDMAQYLKDVRKLEQVNSITSFTSGTCASAGLWLATVADDFYASKMSQVGSVGVLAVHREYTAQMEQWGIKATVFRSAKYKALGNPYEKLSETAKKKIEDDIMKAHQFFVDALVENLGLSQEYVSTELATGEVWYGADAYVKRLIKGVKTFNQVFVALQKKTNENTVNYQSRPTEVDMKSKRITPQMQAALAAGVPVDEALKTAADAEEGTEEGEGTEEEDTTKEVPEEEEVDKSVDKDKEASSSDLIKQFAALNDQLVEARVGKATAEAELTKMKASIEGLKKIAATAIQRAFVAVGSPAPSGESLMAMDPSALLAQHASADAMLQQRFPVGGRVSAQAEDGDNEAMSTLAQMEEQRRLDLASFHPKK